MNELELLRAQLLGIRAQADAALRDLTQFIERVAKEQEKPRPRYLGDPDPKEE